MASIELKYNSIANRLIINLSKDGRIETHTYERVDPEKYHWLADFAKGTGYEVETSEAKETNYKMIDLGKGHQFYLNEAETCFVANSTDGGKILLDAEAVTSANYKDGRLTLNDMPYDIELDKSEAINMLTYINMMKLQNGMDAVIMQVIK